MDDSSIIFLTWFLQKLKILVVKIFRLHIPLKNNSNLTKQIKQSKNIPEISKKPLKPVGSKLGAMYSLSKLHKASIDNCPPFRLILSALKTHTYELSKFLLPVLKPLTSKEFTVQQSFSFC